jgi:hypothetical protein
MTTVPTPPRTQRGAAQPGGCPMAGGGRHIVSIHGDDEHSRTTIANDEHCLDVQLDGRVEYTADDDDVASLSSGGVMSIAESRGGVTRTAVLRERGGRIEREFTRNGAPTSFEEGQAWLRTIIPVLARESSTGVPQRVARIRRQRGIAGVLDDLHEIASDGVKRAWLETLLQGGSLSSDDLRQMALAARSIASDGDKAAALRAIAERAGNDPSVGMAIVSTARTIASDGDRHGVLARVVGSPAPTGAVLGAAVQAAKEIASDGDKAAVLRTIVARAGALPAVRAAVVDAAATIASDGDRADVLGDVLASPTDEATLVDALGAARGIASDGDRHRVLTAALRHTTLASERVRAAFLAAVDGIASDGDHAQVLLAALGRSDLAPAALPGLIHSAARIAADGDKAGVLAEVARRPHALDEPATRTAFFDALKTVASSSDYRRVMELVTR